MNDSVILALIIAIIVLLVLWHTTDMQKYANKPGVDYTRGARAGRRPPRGVVSLGPAQSAQQCQKLAGKYDAYTLKKETCYGVNFGRPDPSSVSGLRPIYGGKLGSYYGAIDRKLASRPGGEKMLASPVDDVEFVVKGQSHALARAPQRVESLRGVPDMALSRALNDDTYPVALNSSY